MVSSAARIRDVPPNRCLPIEARKARKRKPRERRIRQDAATPYRTSTRCPADSQEPSCSSRERRASPSVRIDSSSCGSTRVLPPSSVRREPCTPQPGPHRPPATAESLRIGADTSLDRRIRRDQRCHNSNNEHLSRPSRIYLGYVLLQALQQSRRCASSGQIYPAYTGLVPEAHIWEPLVARSRRSREGRSTQRSRTPGQDGISHLTDTLPSQVERDELYGVSGVGRPAESLPIPLCSIFDLGIQR